jgi:hypothetical protein
MARVPNPPSGWSASYGYNPNTASGVFTVSAAGDGTSVSMP